MFTKKRGFFSKYFQITWDQFGPLRRRNGGPWRLQLFQPRELAMATSRIVRLFVNKDIAAEVTAVVQAAQKCGMQFRIIMHVRSK